MAYDFLGKKLVIYGLNAYEHLITIDHPKHPYPPLYGETPEAGLQPVCHPPSREHRRLGGGGTARGAMAMAAMARSGRDPKGCDLWGFTYPKSSKNRDFHGIWDHDGIYDGI